MDKMYLKYNVLDNGKNVIDLKITLYKEPLCELTSDRCTVLVEHKEDIYFSDDYNFLDTKSDIPVNMLVFYQTLWYMLDKDIYDVMEYYKFNMQDFFNEKLASEILLIFTNRIQKTIQQNIFNKFKLEDIELLYGKHSEQTNPLYQMENEKIHNALEDLVGASIFK